MDKSEEKKVMRELQAEHIDPAWAAVHNSFIDIRIQAFREAIELIEKRIQELEAEKFDPRGK